MPLRVRRLTAAVLLANYAALVVGLPLPTTVGKDASRPFPCQHRRCACATAQQCAGRCCCFTHQQKLAWYAAHDLTPPTEMMAAGRPEPPKPTGCCTAAGLAKRGAQPNRGHHHPAAPPEQSSPATWLVTVQALECEGLAALWLALGTAGLLESPARYRPDAAIAGWLVAHDDSPLRVVLSFDPPPPKV